MKKYIIPLSLIASTVLISSCRKLDEINPSGATAEAVWSTPEGMITLINGAYNDQRNFYGKEDAVLLTEGGTDLWFNQNKASYANQITRYEGLTASSSGTNTNTFTTFYKALNLANAGIGRIQAIAYPSAEEKNRRLGELRFLRGWYLWHIVEFYGGASLRTTETQGAVMTATRSTPEDFYKVIIEDLEFAKQNLPLQDDWGLEYSRASKKSAAGLLARVLLTRAYYSTGAEATTYFTRARDAAQEVINRAAEFKIALWPNYADLWLPANNKKVGAAGGESLYTISNSASNTASNYDNNANRMHMWYLPQYASRIGALVQSLQYGADQRRLQPTRALLDMYNEDIDARYEGSFQEVWLTNSAANYIWSAADVATHRKNANIAGRILRPGLDTALYITKRGISGESALPYLVFDRDTMYNANGTIAGVNAWPALIKFAYPNRTAPNSQPGFNDIFMIRFAEMYLIAAEAEFRLGNSQAAANFINVIRTRAAKKAPVNQTAAMQVRAADINIQFILDERAREFAGEQIRWFDLKRSLTPDQWVQRIKTLNPDITAVLPTHRLRPIPQQELDALLNKAEFGQNPGY
ncbi:RagB/SusD family nutrient uptake outer membrane protein [Segetibacter sp. 3557_3]|uniref:RagB/SusD family nutrient uptake outer membrane protein n=1 Tax=Segetibacter sp. 3557_3 TaxID=2547429 RepID=UPI001058DFB3|nr:RagB/SusD family nutrient uptake outer membrane protein [Segetibacter sp. 3557_3]TDH27482.1 RagB/SusD family nutrient uptake outer membrane protein [Segetibacter sp. 3557_3]